MTTLLLPPACLNRLARRVMNEEPPGRAAKPMHSKFFPKSRELHLRSERPTPTYTLAFPASGIARKSILKEASIARISP